MPPREENYDNLYVAMKREKEQQERMKTEDPDKKDNTSRKGFDLQEVLHTIVWTAVEKGDLVDPVEGGHHQPQTRRGHHA